MWRQPSRSGPQETFATVNPFNVAASDAGLVPIDIAPRDVDPGFVLLSQNGMRLSGARVSEHHDVGVLATIELLNNELVRARRPFHARQVGGGRGGGEG